MSSQYGEATDEQVDGFEVNEEIEIGDLSTQRASDGAIDTFRRVGFSVVSASIDRYEYEGVWQSTSLKLQIAVGPAGVDGDGKYANKRFFPKLAAAFNPEVERFTTDYYKQQARVDLKQFLAAAGYDIANPPKLGDQLCSDLAGVEFVADIVRKEKRAKVDGEWTGTGEFENQIKNFRKVE